MKLCFNYTSSKNRTANTKRNLSSVMKNITLHYVKKVPICFWPQLIIRSPTQLVLVIKVAGVKCPTLIDTGAESSYAPASFINRLNKNPTTKNVKKKKKFNECSIKENWKKYKRKVRDFNARVRDTYCTQIWYKYCIQILVT